MTRTRARPWPQGVTKKFCAEELRSDFSFPREEEFSLENAKPGSD